MIEVSADPLPLTLVKTPLVAPILPTLALPLTLNVPATFTPVPVIFAIVFPAEAITTLPLLVGTLTLEVPLATPVPLGNPES